MEYERRDCDACGGFWTARYKVTWHQDNGVIEYLCGDCYWYEPEAGVAREEEVVEVNHGLRRFVGEPRRVAGHDADV